MDIKSLNEYIKPTDVNGSLNNLFRPVLLRPDIKKFSDIGSYEVKQEEEMRIDLILQNIYEIPSNQIFNYLEQIDVLLALNNIDNPLNIRRGMVIYYPLEIGKLDDFRNNQTENQDLIKSSVAKKLSVPNKTTRKDKSRSAYLESGYSLPPVVQEIPKPPVRIDNDRFSIGGL
jgi:hypothetical protein